MNRGMNGTGMQNGNMGGGMNDMGINSNMGYGGDCEYPK